MAVPKGRSSLPANLVNRVADCLLATNDLDCYTAMRAVCHKWRSSTTDPRTNPRDPRFRPSRWVMLGEIDYYYYTRRNDNNDPLLFVNTGTGRFLRGRLPLLLRGYHLFTTTTAGYLVVEDAGPPYATWLLSPFTGSSIRFKARMPPEDSITADAVFVADRPTLVAAGRTSSDDFRFYLADPDSKEFSRVHGHGSCFDTTKSPLLLLLLCADVAPGEFLVVNNRQPHVGLRVFKITMNSPAGPATERVRSIGDYALFIGTGRCIAVRADSFPSIKANCIYYKEREGARSGTYWVYDLARGREERIFPSAILPATLAQLFADYTVCSSKYGHLLLQRDWKSSRFLAALRRLRMRSQRH